MRDPSPDRNDLMTLVNAIVLRSEDLDKALTKLHACTRAVLDTGICRAEGRTPDLIRELSYAGCELSLAVSTAMGKLQAHCRTTALRILKEDKLKMQLTESFPPFSTNQKHIACNKTQCKEKPEGTVILAKCPWCEQIECRPAAPWKCSNCKRTFYQNRENGMECGS